MKVKVLLSYAALFVVSFFAIQTIVFIILHAENITLFEQQMFKQTSTSPPNPLLRIINYKTPTHHFHTSIVSNPFYATYPEVVTPPFFMEQSKNIDTDTCLSIFDSLFDESKSFLAEPPCLLADMRLYLGSVSVSLSLRRIHFPIIAPFEGREYQGTYEQIIEHEYHNSSHYFLKHPFFETQSMDKLYQFDTTQTSQYRCIYKVNNKLVEKPVVTKTNHQGGSILCDLTDEMISLLEQRKSIQGMLVSVSDTQSNQGPGNWKQLLAKFTLKHPLEMNLHFPPTVEYHTRKAFRMILSCAPLLWEQIRQGVIIEWIEFHKLVGVDHFFIYLRDNEEEDLKQIVNYLQPYLDSHTITLIQWRFGPLHELYNAFQLPQSIDTSARASDLSDWFIVSDTDEFFYPVQKDTLYGVMEQESLNGYDMFSALNWFFQGKNRPTEEDPIPDAKYMLQKQISKCSRHNPQGARTKTIGRSGKDVFLTAQDAHYFSFENLKALDTNELYMRHYYSAYGFRYCPFMGQGDEGAHHTLDSSLWERFGEKLAASIDKFHSDWKERSTLQNKSGHVAF